MRIDLNRHTFKRLVQLYLWLFVASLLIGMLQGADAALAARLKGLPSSPSSTDPTPVIAVALIITMGVHLVAAFAMLRFKGWGRTGFWATILFIMTIATVFRLPVGGGDGWSSWMDTLSSGLAGAIVLLSYASGLGAEWFNVGARAPKDS